MKKALTILSLLTIAAIAQAREGFYVGVQVGTGILTRTPKKGDFKNTFKTNDVKLSKACFLGGVYAGYTVDYNEAFSFGPEIGFRYTQRAKAKINNIGSTASGNIKGINSVLSHQMNVLDVLAVGTYRLNPLWDIQGKAGFGVTFDKARVSPGLVTSQSSHSTDGSTSYSQSVSTNDRTQIVQNGSTQIVSYNQSTSSITTDKTTITSQSKTRTKVRPEVGIGIGYMINEDMRISVDALHLFGSKSRINKSQNNTQLDFKAFDKVPSLTSVTVSLQYMF